MNFWFFPSKRFYSFSIVLFNEQLSLCSLNIIWTVLTVNEHSMNIVHRMFIDRHCSMNSQWTIKNQSKTSQKPVKERSLNNVHWTFIDCHCSMNVQWTCLTVHWTFIEQVIEHTQIFQKKNWSVFFLDFKFIERSKLFIVIWSMNNYFVIWFNTNFFLSKNEHVWTFNEQSFFCAFNVQFSRL